MPWGPTIIFSEKKPTNVQITVHLDVYIHTCIYVLYKISVKHIHCILYSSVSEAIIVSPLCSCPLSVSINAAQCSPQTQGTRWVHKTKGTQVNHQIFIIFINANIFDHQVEKKYLGNICTQKGCPQKEYLPVYFSATSPSCLSDPGLLVRSMCLVLSKLCF